MNLFSTVVKIGNGLRSRPFQSILASPHLFTKAVALTIIILLAPALSRNSDISRLPTRSAAAGTDSFAYLPLIRVPPRHVPRVNAPHNVSAEQSAVLWFGQVTGAENYADVRVRYEDSQLVVRFNVMDRLLWYDTSPSPSDLIQWDSATLLVDLDVNHGEQLDGNSYRFDSQLRWFETGENWQASYSGNAGGWTPAAIPFSTELTYWRGNAPNDTLSDKGWYTRFEIPFSSLGLAGPPPPGSTWGLGLVLHDRDDISGPALLDKFWPPDLDELSPASWGILHFGLPAGVPAPVPPSGSTIIRHGVDGAIVEDAAVGGHSICGGQINYWTDWGGLNYAGYTQSNVQNQIDISDWPCFSKYYLTFPLDSIPANKVILTATLTLMHFGNAGGGQWGDPPSSYLQVLTVSEGWSESALTWNNAPLAGENVTTALVPPLLVYPGWPGVPRHFEISRAVVEAYEESQTLRLVLYSSDLDRHTGKYFYTSDAALEGRPYLTVSWGDP